MKPKKILLIAHNFYPELLGMGKYNGEMINWLINHGYDCTVVTTFPYYPYWKVQPPYKNLWFKKEIIKNEKNDTTLTIYRCPSYIPKDPTGKQRAIQDFSFWVSKFFIILKFILTNKKHDLIITVAPPFHLAYLGLLLRYATGGKLLYHVQDLQIEVARDLKLFSNKKILNSLFKAEFNILRSANFVSSISHGMIKKIKAKLNREVVFFPNWVDTNYFCPLPSRQSIKIKWGYKPNDIIILYSGAVGVKQGIEGILQAAEQLTNFEHIKFIICSSGPYIDLLTEQPNITGLPNLNFFPVQPKETFNEFLNMADLHLIIQKANAGDLVMPSKLTTILSVGGASIITASIGTSLHSMVKEYNFGYIVEPGNVELLVKQILEIKLDHSLERKRENARNYAIKYLNVDNVMNNFVSTFLK